MNYIVECIYLFDCVISQFCELKWFDSSTKPPILETTLLPCNIYFQKATKKDNNQVSFGEETEKLETRAKSEHQNLFHYIQKVENQILPPQAT